MNNYENWETGRGNKQ